MKDVSYARARLWTGITGVGTFVVLATVALAAGLPARWLGAAGGSPARDALALLAVQGVLILIALPLDLAGGYFLPKRHRRPHPTPARFALKWLRGVTALAALTTTSGVLLLQAGRAGGWPAALALLAATSVALVLLQEPLARFVGGLRRVAGGPEGSILLRGGDPGFSGGFTGWSARPVLPAGWTRALDPAALRTVLERRRRILRSGSWRLAIVLAIGWNTLGFALAGLLPGAGVTTVAGLVTTALGFTLWTFLGLLLLPTPSREATRAADARMAEDSEHRAQLADAVQVLDRLQDDEPERSAGVESVFHPVPSVRSRLLALGRRRADGARPWHLARTALFLSHAGLSLLPRAVHCNAGRPELWVYLPTDG